jgi:hypothetical protein
MAVSYESPPRLTPQLLTLTALLKKCQGRRAYCGCCVAWLAGLQFSFGLPDDAVLEFTDRWVRWRQGGKIHERARASVDHVVPLSEGGTNHFDNLT